MTEAVIEKMIEERGVEDDIRDAMTPEKLYAWLVRMGEWWTCPRRAAQCPIREYLYRTIPNLSESVEVYYTHVMWYADNGDHKLVSLPTWAKEVQLRWHDEAPNTGLWDPSQSYAMTTARAACILKEMMRW